jgi:O-antigen/teichoic acid export membrane protein
MKVSIVLRAVTTSWIAVIANAAVGFALTPFVLHRIGDEAFGLWVLITSVVGYYGILDIGIRSSILRYVSRYEALGDHDLVNEVVSTAFYYYLAACVLLILATYLTVPWVSAWFSVPTALLADFKSLFLLAGVVQGVSLPLIVFAASLEAAGRYDQANLSSVACLILRVCLVVWVLYAGGGFYGVGAVTLLSQILVYVIQVPLAIRAHPGLSIRPHWIRRAVFRDMFRYGSVSLAVGIADKLRERLYPILIAIFLTPIDVTFFSLPMRIMAFPVQGVGAMTEIVNPLSSRLEARNDYARLRQLILLSVQSAFLTLLPLAAFLFVFGRELLTLWVGAQYASAYPLLVLITLGMGAAATQCCLQSMLFGIERHKELVVFRLLESVSVALLGSVALRIWGLEGFAAVLAVTLVVTSFVLVPRHLCKILELSLRQYLLQGCVKPFLITLPTAAVFIAWRHIRVADSWAGMVAAVLAGGLVYLVTLVLVTLSTSRIAQRWLQLGALHILARKFLPACAPLRTSATPALASEEQFVDL